VIDNSVDEALAGHAKQIDVMLHADGSCEVGDDGRGMPVDIHPEEKIPGVELILTRLHAGGKFSNKNYTFSGGLHGVGVSVVNALSKKVDVYIKRDGSEYHMAFRDGFTDSALKTVGTVGKRNTGTRRALLARPEIFRHAQVQPARDQAHPARQGRALPRSARHLVRRSQRRTRRVVLRGRLARLPARTADRSRRAAARIVPRQAGERRRSRGLGAVLAALVGCERRRRTGAGKLRQPDPTAQGGTHVNGLRSGLTDALREFCDFRNLLPRGVKLAPEDVWDRLAFVLSIKLTDPQFSGQTKERLSSRQAAAFVEGAVHDAFSLWLNQHVELGEKIAQLAIERAFGAAQDREADRAQENRARPRPARQAGRLLLAGSVAHRTVPGRRRLGRRQRQASARQGVPGHPSLRGKILNTWEVESSGVLVRRKCTIWPSRSAAIPARKTSTACATARW
jgi:topoisomerase-4 subunit B